VVILVFPRRDESAVSAAFPGHRCGENSQNPVVAARGTGDAAGSGTRRHHVARKESRMTDFVSKTVAEVMTRRIITLGEDDTLEAVEPTMERFRFRHLPVVRGRKLVGLITHRDMLALSASRLSRNRAVLDEQLHKLPARSIMCTAVVTASPTDRLDNAARLMWDMKIGCLCVTDDDDNLVGILTEADFVRLAIDEAARARSTPPPFRQHRAPAA
jgi:CBS domain-containing protein